MHTTTTPQPLLPAIPPGEIPGTQSEDLPAMALHLETHAQTNKALLAAARSSHFSSGIACLREALSGVSGPESRVSHLLGENIARLQESFIETLYQRLEGAEIDFSEKVTLRLGGEATLQIMGEHPYKPEIDDTLSRSPDLSRLFNEIAAQSAALRNIQHLQALLAVTEQEQADVHPLYATYQISLKGEMSHFYFAAQ